MGLRIHAHQLQLRFNETTADAHIWCSEMLLVPWGIYPENFMKIELRVFCNVANRQTDRQGAIQTYIYTDRQTDRQTKKKNR